MRERRRCQQGVLVDVGPGLLVHGNFLHSIIVRAPRFIVPTHVLVGVQEGRRIILCVVDWEVMSRLDVTSIFVIHIVFVGFIATGTNSNDLS